MGRDSGGNSCGLCQSNALGLRTGLSVAANRIERLLSSTKSISSQSTLLLLLLCYYYYLDKSKNFIFLSWCHKIHKHLNSIKMRQKFEMPALFPEKGKESLQYKH